MKKPFPKSFLTMTLLAAWLTLSIAERANAADKPNFVFLISEDNSKHFLKLFDDTGADTPRIAELAKHGLIFDNAFSNAPVCSVARTTLITSCYGPRIGTQYHRRSKLAAMPQGLRMFPAYLRDAGYYTANNQKKDYNAIEGDGVWDASSRKASWRSRAAGQPFFYKQTFATTHEGRLHFPASAMAKETATDTDTVFVPPYHPKTEIFRYTYARYHDLIKQVDAEIGQVVDKLAKDGLLENTFIFYFGDHGGVLPRGKGYAYETGLHVPLVVRIPKNFKHLVDRDLGSRAKGFVSFIDFGPTLLNLADVEVPAAVDGKPFLGQSTEAAEVESRDESFGYADRFDEKWDLVRTLRKGKFEYVRNYQPFNYDGLQNNYRYQMLAYQEWRTLFRKGQLNRVQSQFFLPRSAEALYDIESDPYETTNLADDPAYAETLMLMRKRMQDHVKAMPDLSLIPESVLYDEAMADPVGYGHVNHLRIEAAVDVADLALARFADAKPAIGAALDSPDYLQRYWGLIACSCHGQEAVVLADRIAAMAAGDPNRLVRVRAAEFLGLTGSGDPVPAILEVLKETKSGVEAGLILNTVVLLQDREPGYSFGIRADLFSSDAVRKNDSVARRLTYLDPKPPKSKR